ncbi:MAG: DUF692 domain-containing protein [Chitinophagales bacterium]
MVGIGFRKDFSREVIDASGIKPDFIELAPENWIEIGGYWKKELKKALEKYPLYTHGLSLSVGSPDDLDYEFLAKVKKFLNETGALIYSEHLSFSKCSNAHLYDLLPIPFTDDAVKHVASKIRKVQDFLEQRIAIEIVSYYSPVAAEMSEIDFVNAVLEEADCLLLLDINNIYVNSFNHQYNSREYIDQLPFDRIAYMHMAGHEKISDDLIIDTHGKAIIDPVYELFDYAIKTTNLDLPVLLERDFNIPEMKDLQYEINRLKNIKRNALKSIENAVA